MYNDKLSKYVSAFSSEELGFLIHESRLFKNINIFNLSEQTGLSIDEIDQIEIGNPIEQENCLKILDFLKIDLENNLGPRRRQNVKY